MRIRPTFGATIFPEITLTTELKSMHERVDRRIAAHDHMAATKNLNHYFSVGASAISVIEICLSLAGVQQPSTILDFACGAGRVTRWLKAAYPCAQIIACDVRDADLIFQKEVLEVEVWKSSTNLDDLQPFTRFDIIWVGSLLSHLPEPNARSAIVAFMKWLNPNGILVVSFHGRRVALGQSMRNANYISPEKFATVQRSYLQNGFGYEDYVDQSGLGFALTKPDWFFELAAPHVYWKVLGLFEAAWDDHHDICAIQNSPICIRK